MLGGVSKHLTQGASDATEANLTDQRSAHTLPQAGAPRVTAESKSRSQVQSESHSGRQRTLAWLEKSKAGLSGVLHLSCGAAPAPKSPVASSAQSLQVYPELKKIVDASKVLLQNKLQEIEQTLAQFPADAEIQEIGKKICQYYANGLAQANKLESQLFSHIKFTPDQGVEHAVHNARGQQSKDPVLDAALAKYDKSAGNTGYRLFARKHHIPLPGNKKKSDTALEELRTALRVFTRPQAAAMAQVSVNDVIAASSKPTEKACLKLLQDEYAKHGNAVFNGNALAFAQAASPNAVEKFSAKLLQDEYASHGAAVFNGQALALAKVASPKAVEQFTASLMDLKWDQPGQSELANDFPAFG